MLIRPALPADAAAVAALLQTAHDRAEVLYRPLPAEEIASRFFAPNMTAFAAEAEGRVVGFIHGTCKELFLGKENAGNTPMYLTLILVAPEARGQGIGTALLNALKEAAAAQSKHSLHISSNNPLQLTWLIPGTPGHDHNNIPGADVNCAGFGWLGRRGFAEDMREISLYIDLSTYRFPEALHDKTAALAAEGIRVGVWRPEDGTEYDGMCDRVGSEYWRRVLREEIAAHLEGRPNACLDLWPDGRCPAGPRPMLTAAKDGHIIGFTGPVDLQQSGRGWFTGICVDPLYGGKGIATLLFNLLMQAFVDKGAAFSSIFTGKTNHAQKVYLRAGFSQHAEFAIMTLPLDGESSVAAKYF